MYIEISYDQEFYDLIMWLRNKYPKKLFDLSGIGKQLDMNEFSKGFFTNTTSTSDVSIDANSNVDDSSIIAYTKELPKPFFLLNSYFVLWKKMRQLYGKQRAAEVVEKQLTGSLYIHDFHGIGSAQSYCFNYSTMDIVTSGLPMIKKIKSVQPKYLYSFKSQIEQFTVIASNSTLGATGFADIFLTMSAFVKRLLDTKSDAGFKFATIEDCWIYVRETMVSFIYTINQPMRGAQSPFTNVSIFDDPFLDKLLPDYKWIVGDQEYQADKDVVKALQEMFLDIMNQEMRRTPVTFPVTTACFSVDDEKNIQDKEFLSFISQKNLEFGFINLYCGKTSTLSSCCFEGSEVITVKDSNGSKIVINMKDFVEMFSGKSAGEGKVEGYSISSLNTKSGMIEDVPVIGFLKKENNYKKLVKIVVGEKEMKVTPDHIFWVKDDMGNQYEVSAQQILENPEKYQIPVM